MRLIVSILCLVICGFLNAQSRQDVGEACMDGDAAACDQAAGGGAEGLVDICGSSGPRAQEACKKLYQGAKEKQKTADMKRWSEAGCEKGDFWSCDERGKMETGPKAKPWLDKSCTLRFKGPCPKP